jgi:hypothetical protein
MLFKNPLNNCTFSPLKSSSRFLLLQFDIDIDPEKKLVGPETQIFIKNP